MPFKPLPPPPGAHLLRLFPNGRCDCVPIVAVLVSTDRTTRPVYEAATGDTNCVQLRPMQVAVELDNGFVFDLDREYPDADAWLAAVGQLSTPNPRITISLQYPPPKGNPMSTSNRVVLRQKDGVFEYFVIAADGAVLREGTVPNEATVVVDTNV